MATYLEIEIELGVDHRYDDEGQKELDSDRVNGEPVIFQQ